MNTRLNGPMIKILNSLIVASLLILLILTFLNSSKKTKIKNLSANKELFQKKLKISYKKLLSQKI